MGVTGISTGRKQSEGRHRKHAVRGLLMPASPALMPEGLPPGLTAAKVRSRSKFTGTAALERKINPARVPVEQKESMRRPGNLRLPTELTGPPGRCVHVGDRERDSHEPCCLTGKPGTGFPVRSCVDRLAGGWRHDPCQRDGKGAVRRHPRGPVPRCTRARIMAPCCLSDTLR